MKPFNYEAAKNGAPVCTRNGRPARIICWDRINDKYPIVAVHINGNGMESVPETYTGDGHIWSRNENELDLMMSTVHHEGWVNVYRRKDGIIDFGGFHTSEYEAKLSARYCDYTYITTSKIEWEE